MRFLRIAPRRVEDLVAYPEGRRIYREHHNLRREQMDQDALKVINRLQRHGFRAYLVGGCVRDMLLGKKPKDFDVVTNATPSQIRKIFTNSRNIGRRFKIVHVIFKGGKVIEVSTFRSLPQHRLKGDRKRDSDFIMHRDNDFGTPVEDAARRDFTINALYFDSRNESIIDYVGGYDDIKSRQIRVIGDPDMSFREDPVRMLRAAKFGALIQFALDPVCLRAVRRNKDEMTKASTARMLEEYNKIFRTGRSSEIFTSLAETGLFRVLFPEESDAVDARGVKVENFAESSVGRRLNIADKMLHEREELTSVIFFALIILDMVWKVYSNDMEGNLVQYVKRAIDPVCRRMNLPGRDRDRLLHIFVSQSRFLNKKKGRKHRPDQFRQKEFFYEAFMVFKIYAISENDEDAIQQAMFWEIGPRSHPPESHKIISMFPVRRFHTGERSAGRERSRERTRKGKDRRRRSSQDQDRVRADKHASDSATVMEPEESL